MPRTVTGLTVPRTESAEMQRFFEQISQRMTALDGEIRQTAGEVDNVRRSTGGLMATSGLIPDGPPNLATPPTPIGVEVLCGIGLCIVSWINPFRIYSNHALARVFRNTVDQFDTAAEIGTSEWLVYVDDDAMGQTDYWYWVQFESTTAVLGQPSDSVMARTAVDPEAVYEELRENLLSSPLAAVLNSDIALPAAVTEEIRRISAIVALLAAGAADSAADAADAANTLAGTANTLAGTANDAVTQARADLATLTGRVGANEGTLTTLDGSVTSLMADVAQRATIAALTALTGRVTGNEAGIAANVISLTQLTADVAQRATITALTALGGRVDGNENNIAANTLSITELAAEVAGKAAVTALNILTARVATAEGSILANSAEVTALEAAVGLRALGPLQNTFMGDDRAAAEDARDAYETANPTWLAQYDADNDINIELQWGILYVYQRRVGSAWVDNGEPLARAAAVTTLNASVQQQGMDIEANATSIAQLITDIAGLATVTAFTALMQTVTAQDGRIDANAASITQLTADIADRATVAALNVLMQTVTANGGRIDANAASIVQLTADIAGLASATALAALIVRVTDTEAETTANTEAIETLEARSGVALGPEQNEFPGDDRAAAETARDDYGALNAAWLAMYDANPGIAIELTWQ